jgi:hypothetical protein
MGTSISFLKVKPRNYSPASIAKVKNACSYTSTPPYVFFICCLIKHRDNFTLQWRVMFQVLFGGSDIPRII